LRLDPGDLCIGFRFEIVAAIARLGALPVGDVGVRFAFPRTHRRPVDRFLEARGELHANRFRGPAVTTTCDGTSRQEMTISFAMRHSQDGRVEAAAPVPH
jgi:hypothetical protein